MTLVLFVCALLKLAGALTTSAFWHRLEWTVRDLKHLFDTSKGESKSKVVKSTLFGGGKWQCLFYPNSGTDGGAYVSLYLSCEVGLRLPVCLPSVSHSLITFVANN